MIWRKKDGGINCVAGKYRKEKINEHQGRTATYANQAYPTNRQGCVSRVH
jgi:hypothetical protein